jgi:hypothetical protein
MAITVTMSEFVREAMNARQLLAPGEDPSSRDRDLIVKRYRWLLEEMRDERITYWAEDTIPYEAMLALVEVVMLACQSSFGFPSPTGRDMDDAIRGAKRRIRARVVKPSSGLAQRNEFM